MKNKQPKAANAMETDATAVEKPKLGNKEYEKKLRELQAELCAVQDWVVATKQRIIIIFEGRDAAGKGGTIKASMPHAPSTTNFNSVRHSPPHRRLTS